MIRVVIVTDVRFYREGLAELLPRSRHVTVVGTASGGEDAVARVRECDPDIVLFDTALPDGLSAVASIAAVAPRAKVMALALSESDDDIIRWAEAGVAGYVPRDASVDDLVAAVESTARGELRCSPRVAATMMRRLASLGGHANESGTSEPPLTQREREIVRLIGEGMSNKDIARRLGIQVATAKTHVHNILEKLHVRRRFDILARGLRRM